MRTGREDLHLPAMPACRGHTNGAITTILLNLHSKLCRLFKIGALLMH